MAIFLLTDTSPNGWPLYVVGRYARRVAERPALVSLIYTALTVLLIELGVLKPIEGYVPRNWGVRSL